MPSADNLLPVPIKLQEAQYPLFFVYSNAVLCHIIEQLFVYNIFCHIGLWAIEKQKTT